MTTTSTSDSESPGSASPLSSFLCSVAIAVPTSIGCFIGCFGWGQLLAGSGPDAAWAPLLCGGVPISLVLGVSLGVAVVRWRARAGASALSNALLAAVLVVSGGFLASFASTPSSFDREMRLTIHTAASDYFAEDHAVAVGEVVAFGGGEGKVPLGWLPADGRALVRADYPELSQRLGIAFGGDEATVRLPRLEALYSPDLVRFDELAGRDAESGLDHVFESHLLMAPPTDAHEEDRRAGEVLWLVRVRP